MLKKLTQQILVSIATLLLVFVTFLASPMEMASAKVISSQEIHLFLPQEWESFSNKTNLEVAAEINQRLDLMRDEVGRAILQKIHSLGVYKETEPVFFAPHDGGIYVYRFVIHWDRDLKVTERKHITVVDWEVVKNQHYRAIVKSDDSTFAINNIEDINFLFSRMLNQNT